MNKLTMTVGVGDDVDPSLVDPHEAAERLLADYNEYAFGHADVPGTVTFVAAEWDDATTVVTDAGGMVRELAALVLNLRQQGHDVDGIVHLSIKRNDRKPMHDWRHLQRIKNELMGPEREAVEIYPAESRLVDGANQFHLWVFPTGVQVPLGFNERDVASPELAASVGARQRPFDDGQAPDDIDRLGPDMTGAVMTYRLPEAVADPT